MLWVFEQSLQGAADLLIEQLEMAKAKEHSVQVSANSFVKLRCHISIQSYTGFKSNQLTLVIESHPYRRLWTISFPPGSYSGCS